MKKIYVKILTGYLPPSKVLEKTDLKPLKIFVKGEKAADLSGGIYGYNGIVIGVKNQKHLDGKFKEKISTILKKLSEFNGLEYSLYLEMDENNSLFGTYINHEFLKFLGDNGISLNII